MVDIRILRAAAELEAVVDVEIAVWGLLPRDAVPSALLHVLALRGGLVLGAYDGDQIIGVLVSLPAHDDDGEWILWSHMTGVHAAYQGQGIGAALKRFQREWALGYGYRKIRWTVDPMQRGNARFNFHLLGADAAMIARVYHVHFYGDMDDDINRGIPSDRIEAEWLIDQPSTHVALPADAPSLLHEGDAGQPVSSGATWDAPAYRVAVPRSLTALRANAPENVLAWRLAIRDALQAAFAHGYAITDFLSETNMYIIRQFRG